MNMKKIFTILFLIFYLSMPMVSAIGTTTTYTGRMFTIPNDVAVTSVDTDETGLILTAGFANGSIAAYDTSGNVLWKVNTNASITKILSDSQGNIVYLNTRNETGYITKLGVSRSVIQTTNNVTDISITRDGAFYATSSYSPAVLNVYTQWGNLSGSNTSVGLKNWTHLALDPNGEWMTTSNASDNKLYLWNVTLYRGWEEFNPTRSVNSSLNFIDSFPYRRNLSVVSYTNHTNINFRVNNTNTTDILKINESYYEFNNFTTGNYFYFSTPGNYTDRQTEYVNYSYNDNSLYRVVFKPTWRNITMYYGNLSYNTPIYASTSGSQVFTGSGTFTVPPFINSVSYQIIGGGGTGVTNANGGGAGQNLVSSVATTPGTAMGVTVGGAGASSSFGGATATAGSAGGAGSPTGAAGYVAGVTAGNGDGSTQYFQSEGGTYNCYGWGVVSCSSPGGTGGSGYGAGGGAGNTACGCGVGGNGVGAQGYVGLSWTAAAVDYGKAPTKTIFPTTRQSGQTLSYLTYVAYTSLNDYIQQMHAPEGGGYVGVSDSAGLYIIPVSKTGFDEDNIIGDASGAGISYSVALANGGSYLVNARGATIEIMDSNGYIVGYTTGGMVLSTDIGMKNGLWAVSGGTDGKLYVNSKDLSSDWQVFYQGDSGEPINSVAMTWRGEIECLGRTNGNFECYDNRLTEGEGMDFEVFVYYNGLPYQTFVNVQESSTYPYNWHDFTTSNVSTDSNGKAVVLDAKAGNYYKLIAGAIPNQKTVYYTASQTTNQVVISIENIVNTVGGFNYTAFANASYPGNITIQYTDNTLPNSVDIRVAEASTGKVVYNQQFTSASASDINVIYSGNPNIAYNIQWVWDRDGVRGMAGQTVYVPSPTGSIFKIIDPLMMHTLFFLLIAFVGGLFTRYTREIGALLTALLYTFFVVFGFLPYSLVTLASLVCIIAFVAIFGQAKEMR